MSILDFVYPKKCLGCKEPGEYVCSKCLADTRYALKTCPICFKLSKNGISHKNCRNKARLDGFFAVWNYERVLRKAILALKYKFADDIAKELATKLVLELKKEKFFQKNFLLVPIPIDKKRGRWRGFNQTEIIGKIVAAKMGWKYRSDILKRIRFSKPQTELKGEERKKNILGVFKVDSNDYINEKVLLFDDVWTTGSTIKEAAKVLKNSGYNVVFALVLAKRQ